MELYFNELSLQDSAKLSYSELSDLADVYRAVHSSGITCCRISSKDYCAVLENVKGAKERNFRDLLYAFLKPPYENPAVDKKEDEYLEHRYTTDSTTHYAADNEAHSAECNEAHNAEYQAECFGLALAYIMHSATVSISRAPWKTSVINIFQDDTPLAVLNYYDSASAEQNQEWLESLKEVELVPSTLLPEEKKIDLRDDHGKKELKAFAERLRRNQYVEEIVNSLPFNQNTHTFIRRIRPNGLVELVLRWTDEGFGLVVKTTGRNYRETEKIAKILKDEFDN